MVIKNKKAWLKVVEAFIAILIIIGTILYIMNTFAPKKDISESVYEKERYILDSITKEELLRAKILNAPIDSSDTTVDLTIKNMIPNAWDFETKICDLNSICESIKSPRDRDIYVSEIVVSSNTQKYEPRKIRLFVWMK